VLSHSGVSRPYVRRDTFVPSVRELGIPLGVCARIWEFGEGGSLVLTSEQGSQAIISKLKRIASEVGREAVRLSHTKWATRGPFTSRDGELDVLAESRFSKESSNLQRLHFLVEGTHTHRSLSPFRVAHYTTASRLIICLLGLIAVLASVHPSVRAGRARGSAVASQPIDVGMVALLASPEEYCGEIIRTVGFMCLEIERNALYLHEEDSRYRATENVLELELSKAQQEQFRSLRLRHVLTEDTILVDSVVTSTYGASIGNITRLEHSRPRGISPLHPKRNRQHAVDDSEKQCNLSRI
jgi:hypothetical protein